MEEPTRPPLAETLHRKLGDRIAECVHCGFCLPTCPTYSELGTEPDSPRGRIHLVKALSEGRIEPTPTVTRHLDLCLDCRACETACPSGVRYGSIIEGARTAIEAHRPRALWLRFVRWAAFRHLLPSRRLLSIAVMMLRLYQKSGLQKIVRKILPSKLREMDALAPQVRGGSFTGSAPQTIPAVEPKRGRVALFVGCIMDQAMGPIHHATARVLARNGYEVVTPLAQTCCGALHVHNGEGKFAATLAKANIIAFEECSADRVIINSAGCGAAIREYDDLLEDEPEWRDRARAFSASVTDISTFLGEIELRPPRGVPAARATYDEPCHLLHAQKVSAQPRAVLNAIPGLDVIPLREAEWCCGAAGIYNLTEPQMSGDVLERKMKCVEETGADILVTANPGCLIQLEAGVRKRGLDMKVVHLIELLDQAYQDDSGHNVPASGVK